MIMYIIAILLSGIGAVVTAGGAVVWVCTLLGFVTTFTSMQAFGIMCGGAIMEVIAVVIFMSDGNMLGNMMKNIKNTLDNQDFL